jgi:hypothetical protein
LLQQYGHDCQYLKGLHEPLLDTGVVAALACFQGYCMLINEAAFEAAMVVATGGES